MKINKKAFDFLNHLSGILNISLTKKPVRIGNLLNVRAESDAKIKNAKLECKVFCDDSFRNLSTEEEKMIVFEDAKEISIIGESVFAEDLEKFTVAHKKKSGKWSVRDVLKAIEKTEKKTRVHTDWFGGIDVHHIYFEGLRKINDNSFVSSWGS